MNTVYTELRIAQFINSSFLLTIQAKGEKSHTRRYRSIFMLITQPSALFT
jgi:hypothetical protein